MPAPITATLPRPPKRPRSRPGAVVARDRLHPHLDAATAAPITVLQAHSGYGKTTLLRQWALTRVDPAGALCWVSLTSQLDPVDAVAAVLATAEPATVIVIDGYEHAGPDPLDLDARILAAATGPSAPRFLIATRAATTLATPTHLAAGTVRVLTAADLALTEEETATLLGAQLSAEGRAMAAEVHRASRGFPLAVRAAGLTLDTTTRARARRAPGPNPTPWWPIVAQDLLEQVGRHPEGPQVQQFVRDTCPAPYVDLPLAMDLATCGDETDVSGWLEILVADGLGHWSTRAGRRTFTYADALREGVTNDLQGSDPDRYRHVVAVAATWLSECGDHEAALKLAVEAGRYELAGRIVRNLVAGSPEGQLPDHLDRQLSRVPHRVLIENPLLAFARGLALSANPATRGAADEFFSRVVKQDHVEPRSAFFQQAARSMALRHLGQYAEAASAALTALDNYADADLGGPQHRADLHSGYLRHLAYSLFLAGETELSRRTIAKAVSAADQPLSSNDTLAFGIGLAAIDGRVREAAHTSRLIDQDAWSGATGRGLRSTNGLARISEALLHLDRFDFAGALAAYDGWESQAATSEFWPLVAWTRLQARLGAGDVGSDLERIVRALRSHPAPPGVGDNLATAALAGQTVITALSLGRARSTLPLLEYRTHWQGQLAPARLLARLDVGDISGASSLMPRLQPLAGHTIRSRAALATIGAAVALRADSERAAGTLLDRATSAYVEHGVRAHLVHLPREDLDALRDLAQRTDRPGATDYLRSPEVDAVVRAHAGPDTVALTPQEVAVLRASLDHPRRSQLAAALHLSPETVKSHMRNIYRKWGVNSRDAAIARGIQLSVLGGG